MSLRGGGSVSIPFNIDLQSDKETQRGSHAISASPQ
jgi:hypothetical protein